MKWQILAKVMNGKLKNEYKPRKNNETQGTGE
jgi:hypothetical protein